MYSSPGIGIARISYGLKKSGQDPRNQSGCWLGKEAMRKCFRTYIVGAPVQKAFSQRQPASQRETERSPDIPNRSEEGFCTYCPLSEARWAPGAETEGTTWLDVLDAGRVTAVGSTAGRLAREEARPGHGHAHGRRQAAGRAVGPDSECCVFNVGDLGP